MSDSARTRRPVGRPRRSSAETIADAAAELFLENGYAGTTVDQIAQRAGVSRGTFFNYFEAKSDLFWLDLDRTLAGLPERLRASSGLPPVAAVTAALAALADDYEVDRVPWALTQGEAMMLGDDVVTSAAGRFVTHRAVVADYLAERTGAGRHDVTSETIASVLVAAAGTAFVSWARAGVARPSLRGMVDQAFADVTTALGSSSEPG
ncbi:TetR/AcrR family transcriptional regulator [Frigoribacterium sp. 2-23]|uniref:TetR/AcrR family transcriptional regulator n=1 Tax=Frigoribacterium sp. 2-23 TaxID=3415006 RepID=UPI003C6EB501